MGKQERCLKEGQTKTMGSFGAGLPFIAPSFQKFPISPLYEVLGNNFIIGKSLSSGCFQPQG